MKNTDVPTIWFSPLVTAVRSVRIRRHKKEGGFAKSAGDKYAVDK